MKWYVIAVSGVCLWAAACSGTENKPATPVVSATVASVSASVAPEAPPPVKHDGIHCGKNTCDHKTQICCMTSPEGAPPEAETGVCAPRAELDAGFPEGDPYDAEFQTRIMTVMAANTEACEAAVEGGGARIVFCDSSSECAAGKRCCPTEGSPTGEQLPAHCASSCSGAELCGGGDTCRGKGQRCLGGACLLAAEIDCGGEACGGDKVCCNSMSTGKVMCTTYDACVKQAPAEEPLVEQCDGRKVCDGAFCVATQGRSSCTTPPINLMGSELRCTADADCTYEGPITTMNDPGCKKGRCVPGGAGMNLCECLDP